MEQAIDTATANVTGKPLIESDGLKVRTSMIHKGTSSGASSGS
jgi:hypothetical protein